MKRLHITDKELNFENKVQKIKSKPIGLWYGINNSWLDWLKDNQPNWIPKQPIIYDIQLDKSKILFLSSDKEIKEFSLKFGKLIGEVAKQYNAIYDIDWPLISKVYSGIENKSFPV